MKNGSLVVVLPLRHCLNEDLKPLIKWLPIDDEKHEYVLKDVLKNPSDGDLCVRFEEGVIGCYKGMELAIHISFVREVQPPEENFASDLLQQCVEEYSTVLV